MYKAIMAIGIVAAACLVAGCGSSSDETAKAAVTEAQFMKQARKVCAKTQKELTAAFNEANPGFFQRASALLRREAEELDAIAGPDSVESRVEPLVASVTQASEIVAREKQGAQGDPRMVAYKREADKLQLDEC